MLKQETFNAIVNYLATRPYQDVAHLFTMIQNDIEQQQMTNNSPTAIEEEKE